MSYHDQGPQPEGSRYFTPNIENQCGTSPSPYGSMAIPLGTVQLSSNVQYVINLINSGALIPYGDFGGPVVYWFQTFENSLGNIVYTVFDRYTTVGLASFAVRFGAASTIHSVISQTACKSQIELQLPILPNVPFPVVSNGSVMP